MIYMTCPFQVPSYKHVEKILDTSLYGMLHAVITCPLLKSDKQLKSKNETIESVNYRVVK